MSIEKVRAYFQGFGVADRIMEFPVSSATVELAAQALGVEGARIAKSMSFKIGEDPIIIVMAHELIGHDVGGVCSFALPENVKTYLDVSLKRFATVFPAAGSSNSAIEFTCEELERYSSNFVEWVDVCKGWQAE